MTEASRDLIQFSIPLEPASKENSRKVVKIGGQTRIIKSDKARAFAAAARLIVPKLPLLLEGELCVGMELYYASQRPDLDGSLILDVMQGRIYKNDRQVREIHLYHGIDKQNPRADVVVWHRGVR